jgi:hypothetical protein
MARRISDLFRGVVGLSVLRNLSVREFLPSLIAKSIIFFVKVVNFALLNPPHACWAGCRLDSEKDIDWTSRKTGQQSLLVRLAGRASAFFVRSLLLVLHAHRHEELLAIFLLPDRGSKRRFLVSEQARRNRLEGSPDTSSRNTTDPGARSIPHR